MIRFSFEVHYFNTKLLYTKFFLPIKYFWETDE